MGRVMCRNKRIQGYPTMLMYRNGNRPAPAAASVPIIPSAHPLSLCAPQFACNIGGPGPMALCRYSHEMYNRQRTSAALVQFVKEELAIAEKMATEPHLFHQVSKGHLIVHSE